MLRMIKTAAVSTVSGIERRSLVFENYNERCSNCKELPTDHYTVTASRTVNSYYRYEESVQILVCRPNSTYNAIGFGEQEDV